jgi:hypothetical protein
MFFYLKSVGKLPTTPQSMKTASVRAYCFLQQTSVLYHKPIMIVNDDSRVVNKLETSLTDNARVIIYDCHMFIVQVPGANVI